MRLAQRVLRQSESATMAVARRAIELRSQGVDLIDLGAGELSLPSPRAAVCAAVDALEAGHTRYTSIEGPADLRRAIAADIGRLGGPWTGDDDTLVTVGAKSALLQAVLSLVDPGTRVLIPSPCWMTLPAQVNLAGGESELVPMAAEDGYRLRAAPLLERLDDATGAVIVNSPCNPTGAVMAADELERLVVGCGERGVVVIADETYRDFHYGGSGSEGCAPSVAPLARTHPRSVVLISSFSKSWAMTGWRVGYALGDPSLIAAMRLVQSHATSNATSFAMTGALAALRHGSEDLRAHREHCRRNRETVQRILSRSRHLRLHEPEGAFYAFPTVDLDGSTTARFATELLEERRIVVVAGEAFSAPGHLRISFAGDGEELARGLEGLVEAVEGLH